VGEGDSVTCLHIDNFAVAVFRDIDELLDVGIPKHALLKVGYLNKDKPCIGQEPWMS